jgi:hypothetical protein
MVYAGICDSLRILRELKKTLTDTQTGPKLVTSNIGCLIGVFRILLAGAEIHVR